MIEILRKVFQKPTSDDEKEEWMIKILYPIVITTIFAAGTVAIISLFLFDPIAIHITSELIIFSTISFWLLHKKKIKAASYLMIISLYAGALYGIIISEGIHDSAMHLFPAIIIFSSIFFNKRSFIGLAAITILIITIVGIGQVLGIIGTEYSGETTYVDVSIAAFILFGIFIIIWQITGFLSRSLKSAQQNSILLKYSLQDLEEQAAEIRLSESRWRSLVENAPDIILNILRNGEIIFSNRTIPIRSAKFKPDVYRLVPDSYKPVIKQTLDEVFNNGVPSICEVQSKNTDGTLSWIHSHVAPIKEEGKIVSAILIGTDITETKKLQEQLLQSQKMESIGKLAGGIAHDFNNLLTVINGHAQLAETKIENNRDLADDIQAILEAGDKAADLTKQILAFSRKQIIQPELIQVNDVVENLNKIIKRLIGEDITFEVKFELDMPQIKADRNQFEQLLFNLIVNARDAINLAGEGLIDGKICVEINSIAFDESYISDDLVKQSGQHVVITVSDNGIGMNEEIKSNIFEPFFTTKDTGEGTGLGLAMVYGTIKQNNGNIYVYSEPGEGTTFKIFWPAAKPGIEKSSPPKEIMQRIEGTETLLVVEDDHAVRNFACAALESLGYNIFDVASGPDAINFYDKNEIPIDLLVTDIIMPKMNGKKLADILLTKNSDLKILFTSGYTDSHIQSRGILEEGLNFLNKPYSTRDLATKIREILDN